MVIRDRRWHAGGEDIADYDRTKVMLGYTIQTALIETRANLEALTPPDVDTTPAVLRMLRRFEQLTDMVNADAPLQTAQPVMNNILLDAMVIQRMLD